MNRLAQILGGVALLSVFLTPAVVEALVLKAAVDLDEVNVGDTVTLVVDIGNADPQEYFFDLLVEWGDSASESRTAIHIPAGSPMFMVFIHALFMHEYEAVGDYEIVVTLTGPETLEATASVKVLGAPPLTPEQILEELIALIPVALEEGFIKNKGISNSLEGKLSTALNAVREGNYRAAIGALNASLNFLSAQAGKQIDAVIASTVADVIYNEILCCFPPDDQDQVGDKRMERLREMVVDVLSDAGLRLETAVAGDHDQSQERMVFDIEIQELGERLRDLHERSRLLVMFDGTVQVDDATIRVVISPVGCDGYELNPGGAGDGRQITRNLGSGTHVIIVSGKGGSATKQTPPPAQLEREMGPGEVNYPDGAPGGDGGDTFVRMQEGNDVIIVAGPGGKGGNGTFYQNRLGPGEGGEGGVGGKVYVSGLLCNYVRVLAGAGGRGGNATTDPRANRQNDPFGGGHGGYAGCIELNFTKGPNSGHMRSGKGGDGGDGMVGGPGWASGGEGRDGGCIIPTAGGDQFILAPGGGGTGGLNPDGASHAWSGSQGIIDPGGSLDYCP